MFEWLLELGTWKRLEAALKSGFSPTEAQIEAFTPQAQVSESDPRILTRADDKAEILVEGVLTEKFDIIAYLMGGGNTTYQEIRASLALLEQDKTVKSATMVIGSPGGSIVGLFDTIDAIKGFSKPIKTVVRGVAASAAYALAAATDSIEATNKSDRLGSVGIMAPFKVNDKEVVVTSTKAPKKAPDVTTEEGRAIARESLDKLHTLFADAIAEGRGTDKKDVNANYGQGAVLLAEEALKVGMIDKIQTKSKIKPRVNSGRKEAKMDLAKLKAEHPGLYAEVHALGHAEGVKAELDRVSAHLIMGEMAGAMDVAIKAVKDREKMTQALNATYMAAGMNKKDVGTRAADDAAAAIAADGAAQVTEEEKDKAASDKILALAAEGCGVELKA